MNIEQHVTSLQISKRLKELGDANVWVDIAGYEGRYQVSGAGVVKSLARKNGMGSRKQDRDLTIHIKKGYETVSLTTNKKPKFFLIHRLVANAFLLKPEGDVEINHRDGNKLNNRWWNLEWATKSQNMIHARKNGLLGGERTNTAKLTVKKVREMRSLYPRLNSRELSEKYGVGQSTVCKILRKEYWRYA